MFWREDDNWKKEEYRSHRHDKASHSAGGKREPKTFSYGTDDERYKSEHSRQYCEKNSGDFDPESLYV